MTGSSFFYALVKEIRARHPSFKLKYKDESLFQKFLGLLAYPFNAEFMTRYTTTLKSTVYFPSRIAVQANYMRYAKTLAHERVHIWDEEDRGYRYNLGYAMPQLLALPLLVLYAVLGAWLPVVAAVGCVVIGYLLMWVTMSLTGSVAVRRSPFFFMVAVGAVAYLGGAYWLSGWWTALAVAALIPLAPWRSPWRAKWEQRGYGMSLAVNYWRYGSVKDSTVDWVSKAFTTMAYYRMDPNKRRVVMRLAETIRQCETGEILRGLDSEPYGRVYDVIRISGMLKSTGEVSGENS